MTQRLSSQGRCNQLALRDQQTPLKLAMQVFSSQGHHTGLD